jgi:hypothetical protein
MPAMAQPSSSRPAADHRALAIAFNQRAWALLDNKDRSVEEAEEMLIAAYASLAHWLKAGTAIHQQRGEWLVARIYAELGRAEPALHHLAVTQNLTEQHRAQLEDFDVAFAEALAARVYALAGDGERARAHYARAEAMGNALVDAEDRQIFLDQLAEGPWFGFNDGGGRGRARP